MTYERLPPEPESSASGERGIALLEALTSVTIVAFTLLSIATMYLTAQASLKRSSVITVGAALSRQFFEDVRSVPFQSLVEFDGLDTLDVSTLPPNEPERGISRKWRYAIAGESGGWTYSSAEKAAWPAFAPPGGGARGRIAVESPASGVRRVRLTMSVPGQADDIELATLVSRTAP